MGALFVLTSMKANRKNYKAKASVKRKPWYQRIIGFLVDIFTTPLNNISKFNLRFNIAFPLYKNEDKKEQETSQLYTLFSDAPIEEINEDLLERKPIAQQIVNAIQTTTGQLNFLIAGKWGIGKTTVLKGIEEILKNKDIRFVEFSPWKYSKSYEGPNAISRAFLTRLAEDFGKEQEVKDLYIKKQVENERGWITQVLLLLLIFLKYLVYVAVLFEVIYLLITSPFLSKFGVRDFASFFLKSLHLVDIPSNVSLEWQFSIAIAVFFSLPKLGEDFINKIREKGEVEKVSSPELLQKKFEVLITETIKSRRIQKIVSSWEDAVRGIAVFQLLGKPLTRLLCRKIFSKWCLRKLVVFVDDLDRCDEAEVREFLTGMKTFLDNENVYYIIAADVDKLREMADKDEPEYLRKIIHLDWQVPLLDKPQRQTLVKSLLRITDPNNNLSELFDIDRAVALFTVTPDPRSIKYYIRRLIFLLNVYDNEFKKLKNPKITISFLLKLIMVAYLYKPAFTSIAEGKIKISAIEEKNFGLRAHLENNADFSYALFNRPETSVVDLPSVLNGESNGTLEYHQMRRVLFERLEKIERILQSRPFNTDPSIEVDIRTLYRWVGSFEETLSDSKDFFDLTKTDPSGALKKLKDDFSSDVIYLITQLINQSIAQDVGRVVNLALDVSPDTPAERNVAETQLKNELKTALLILEDESFLKMDVPDDRKRIYDELLTTIIKIWSNSVVMESNIRLNLVKVATSIEDGKLWDELLSPTNLDMTLPVLEAVKNINSAVSVQNSLFNKLSENDSNISNKIFDSLLKMNLGSDFAGKILLHLLEVKDNTRITKVLNLREDVSRQSFERHATKIKNYVNSQLSFNDQQGETLLIALWSVMNVKYLDLLEMKFFGTFTNKVRSMQSIDSKCRVLAAMAKSLSANPLSLTRNRAFMKTHIEELRKHLPSGSASTQLPPETKVMISNVKGSMTRLITKLDETGGDKGARFNQKTRR